MEARTSIVVTKTDKADCTRMKTKLSCKEITGSVDLSIVREFRRENMARNVLEFGNRHPTKK
jgi:hypothetical protein